MKCLSLIHQKEISLNALIGDISTWCSESYLFSLHFDLQLTKHP